VAAPVDKKPEKPAKPDHPHPEKSVLSQVRSDKNVPAPQTTTKVFNEISAKKDKSGAPWRKELRPKVTFLIRFKVIL
jgi:hypothetical protein